MVVYKCTHTYLNTYTHKDIHDAHIHDAHTHTHTHTHAHIHNTYKTTIVAITCLLYYSYVSRLKIIAEGFRHCIQTLNTTKSGKVVVPDSTINLIFLNIGEIYNLNTRLLTDLEERMDNWYYIYICVRVICMFV